MLLQYTIEATDDAEVPDWVVVATREAPEYWWRSAAEYGLEMLHLWIDAFQGSLEESSAADRKPLLLTGEQGKPYLRAVVRLAESSGEFQEPVAVVGADQLAFTAR